MKLKVGGESQSVHFKNQDVLIYTRSPSDGEELTNHFNCCRSPKYWTEEPGRSGNALNMRNLQQRWKHERKRGWMGGRDHRESTWWSLFFMPMFVIIVLFFNISYVCIFLPTEERVNKLRENAKWVHECEGRKVLAEWCFPFFFFFFFCVSF